MLNSNLKITKIYLFITPGVDQARRDTEMERLNECYRKVISEKADMRSCLSHMISTESYRMLSGWSYSLKPETLRVGSRVLELPDGTDVIILNYSPTNFPPFFIGILHGAFSRKNMISFYWSYICSVNNYN